MKTKNHTLNGILSGIFEVLVGILLLVNPVGFTSGILIAAGVIVCLVGLKFVIAYFRTDAQEAAFSHKLFMGLMCLVIGWFLAFRSYWIIATFPILTVIYGVVILAFGLAKLQTTVDMLRLKRGRWYLAAISAALSLICGAVILADPFASTEAVWMFTGITLIAGAALDMVASVFTRTHAKEETEA